MNNKNIQTFDKLLKKTTGGTLSTFDEITEIIISLVKIEVDTSQNDLMQRVSKNSKFNSSDDLETFLNGYFEFHNLLIAEFDRVEAIEDDDVFDVEIEKFAKNLLKTIPSENLQELFLGFIFNIVTAVMSEYSIELLDDNDKNLEHLVKVFGDEDLVELYVGVNVIATYLTEVKNIKYDEILDISKSVFIFCMAMNSLRKDDFINAQKQQNYLSDAANSVAYNVGRNDPCPCGSGRKYKKCCLNKDKLKPLISLNLQEPKDILPPLNKKEIHEFYMIWSRFINFVSKAFAGVADEKYIEIYGKNDKGEYFLTDEAIKGSRHYLIIRNFLNEYFFMLLDHFIEDNRVSQKNIDILYEIRDTYKYSKFISFEMFENGNAIFYNLEKSSCFYAYKTFYNYSKVFPKNEIFETMFFSYKGRIISDGVATHHDVNLGDNMMNMMREEYKRDRENFSFLLDINERPSQNIYQLKISIKEAKPPIWRRVLVKAHTSFHELHSIIQSVFDWEDYHMYMFFGKDKKYTSSEMLSEGLFDDSKELLSHEYTIKEELNKDKDKMKYVYDFGDNWEHNIVLEKIIPSDESISYPTCIGGKRRGPLEDSGGIWNYNDIADAMENPTFDNQYILGGDDEQYYEDIDPKEFIKELVNIKLRREFE